MGRVKGLPTTERSLKSAVVISTAAFVLHYEDREVTSGCGHCESRIVTKRTRLFITTGGRYRLFITIKAQTGFETRFR